MKNKLKNAKQQKIIKAASKLFRLTHDIKRVSLEDIAEEAGVSPATIYNNFGDRETLLYEVIKDLALEILQRNRDLVHSNLPFPEKLIGIMSNKMDLIGEVNRELIEKLITQDKRLIPFIDELYSHEIKPLWTEIMAEGKKLGYIDPTLDDKALLSYLDILQAGLKVRPEILKNIGENLDFLEQVTRLMFYGFLKKEIDFFGKRGDNNSNE